VVYDVQGSGAWGEKERGGTCLDSSELLSATGNPGGLADCGAWNGMEWTGSLGGRQ